MEEFFDFGSAIKHLKDGKRVCREGWNGKGMYITYQPGYPNGIPVNANTAKATGVPEGTKLKFHPYILMKTSKWTFVPWVASNIDILAEDWMIAD